MVSRVFVAPARCSPKPPRLRGVGFTISRRVHLPKLQPWCTFYQRFSFPSGIMRAVLKRGIPTLSWTRVIPRDHAQLRRIQIRATPSAEPSINEDHLPLANVPSSVESQGMLVSKRSMMGGLLISKSTADAQFHVVGAPYSLLSVSLSASQNLYTRRGTLVGLSGKADNVRNRLQHSRCIVVN